MIASALMERRWNQVKAMKKILKKQKMR